MEEDLGLVGDQYQVAVSILFVTYCVCRRLSRFRLFSILLSR